MRRRTALVIISHDRRFLSTLSRARSGSTAADPPDRARLCPFRGMARRGAGGRGARPAQARPQDRRRGALDALRRHRAAQAQHAPGRRACRRCAKRAARYRGAAGDATITAGSAAPSGALVIEAKGIGKSYGGRPIVSDFSIRIQRGDRIGIVGPNGSGKTTLINMLTGVLAAGHRLGASSARRWRSPTLDQHRDSLDPNVTVADALTGGGGDTVMVNGAAQARHRLHEGFPVLGRTGAHAARQAVGRRTRPPDAGAGAGQALEPAGARRADQRSRHGNARRAGGHARRLSRHRAAHQPRPRFPRPPGERRDRAGRRRPLDRICRRL